MNSFRNYFVKKVKQNERIEKLKWIDNDTIKAGSKFHIGLMASCSFSKNFFVYKIKNRLTGQFYIGQTYDLKRRMVSHKNSLVELGDPGYWEVTILEVLRFKKPKRVTMCPQIIKLENKHIKRAKARFGKKCINKFVSE